MIPLCTGLSHNLLIDEPKADRFTITALSHLLAKSIEEACIAGRGECRVNIDTKKV
jgi:hypothetical protein